jgi:hypothetical protein
MKNSIDKEIAAAEEKLKKLKAFKEGEQRHTEEGLAEKLHYLLCNANHIDGCSWEYEEDWEKPRHREYLEKAYAVANAIGLEAANKFLDALKVEGINL